MPGIVDTRRDLVDQQLARGRDKLRDRKSRMLDIALRLFIAGFALYCFAVAQLIIATPTR